MLSFRNVIVIVSNLFVMLKISVNFINCNDLHAGVRAQVATLEQASAGPAQNVEAPVVVVTGASRGIGRAIALSLGKAGCKVGDISNLNVLPYCDSRGQSNFFMSRTVESCF